jgi:hypothetical protein
MATIIHPNKTHEAAINLAEMQRQAAIGTSGGSAAAVLAANVAFQRAAIASCKTNGVAAGDYRQGLYNLIGAYE